MSAAPRYQSPSFFAIAIKQFVALGIPDGFRAAVGRLPEHTVRRAHVNDALAVRRPEWVNIGLGLKRQTCQRVSA